MTEGMEDVSAGPARPPDSTVDTGQVPKEKPEETEVAGENGQEVAEVTPAGGEDDDDEDDGASGGGEGEHPEALGVIALPGTCCVCIEMEHISNCLHSEKICILPIVACLLSLALCTAGLKWVFADKIFEYDPPTHSDPKPIGQDPIIISADPTLGIPVSIPQSPPPAVSLTTAVSLTSVRPEVLNVETSTKGSNVPTRGTLPEPSVTLKSTAELPTIPKQTPRRLTTQEVKNVAVPTIPSTSSTTTRVKTSSHVTRCSDSQKNYCVNGGECFTLELPGSTKFLCRCLTGFTGHRCEQAVLKKVSIPKQAEELYQKRILTITGICIALLVVGIMCVVAYCKTKQQRKKLHERLRQNLRKKKNKLEKSASRRQVSNLPLQDLLQTNCNGTTVQHAAEKETETTFSTSKYALSTADPTTLTHISSQSPVATSGSPPSEMSALLSTQAISVPSVAVSPLREERHPLLLTKTCRPTKSLRGDDTSAHYNHGHDAHSLPPSPLCATRNDNYHVTTAASRIISASTEKLMNTNNNINSYSTTGATVVNGLVLQRKESSIDSILESETEILKGDRTPFFFSREKAKALLVRLKDSG
ncbi:pro-neuregulin-1, membrane-bound isoform isoform X2 [Nerophis lumbriciformis]|uniref:pro-neuregulin-1, membrane-bound isoform isoform X2 n=1 Tax=Nerophis lumbriciformis TaxID=546530 RepID=UPI002ADF40C3|nr:pro-neuregulin-1, membrane-bound isoform isoform X2 [Nerophis lumbriciformis]